MLDLRRSWIAVTLSCLAAGAFGCGGVRGGHFCGTDTSGPDESPTVVHVPDGSFEKEPSQWTLQDYASLDDTESCDLETSLRVELNEGVGVAETTRSAELKNLAVSTPYKMSLYFRYDHCKNAKFIFNIGNYERDLKIEGSKSEWAPLEFDVDFVTTSAFLDIHTQREGAASDFVGDDYKRNVLWIDNVQIKPR